MTHFATQRPKRWFKEDLFSGLLRLRGMECNSPTSYAEAFYCRKAMLADAGCRRLAARGRRRGRPRADAPALSDLPQPHRRWRARDVRRAGGAHPARAPRDRQRHQGVRLDRARRVEHPRRATSPRPDGTRVVDFRRSNLHVVGYSEPVRATLSLDALRRAAAHPARSARRDSVPDLLLRPHVGILSLPSPAAASWSPATTRW